MSQIQINKLLLSLSLTTLAMLVMPQKSNAELVFEYIKGAAGGFTLDPSNVHASINVSPITAQRGLSYVNSITRWTFTDWNSGSTSFEDAVAVNDYWEWELNVNPGQHQVRLDSFEIRVFYAFGSSRDLEIRAAVNGNPASTVFRENLVGSFVTQNFFNIDLTDLGTLNPGDNVTFTLAGFNMLDSGGVLGISNFDNGAAAMAFNGTVTAIPEPSSAACLAMLVVGGLTVYRRRQKTPSSTT